MSKICILVPVYNEGKAFLEWLPGLMEVAGDLQALVIVVDDGSERVCLTNEQIQRDFPGVTLLRHGVNCGVGAAIGTGLAFASRLQVEYVLTIDGDGQHDAEDLKLVLHELKKSDGDIVNGSRFLKVQKIPLLRRWANGAANFLTFVMSGMKVTDSQSGMKGFSRQVIEGLQLSNPGYEWCLDVFREASWKGWSVKEVPISVSYSDYSTRKGQGIAVGLDMLTRLMVKALLK